MLGLRTCRQERLSCSRLRNRLQELNIQDGPLDQQLESMRNFYNESAERALGLSRQEHKDWISMETYIAMDKRRMKKEEIGRTNSFKLHCLAKNH